MGEALGQAIRMNWAEKDCDSEGSGICQVGLVQLSVWEYAVDGALQIRKAIPTIFYSTQLANPLSFSSSGFQRASVFLRINQPLGTPRCPKNPLAMVCISSSVSTRQAL